MAGEKDSPSKGPERRPGENQGSGPKRPFSTLDLKATEIPSKATGQGDKAGQASSKPPADAAASPAPEPKKDDATRGRDQSAAAARVAAASASVRAATGPSATASTGPKTSDSPRSSPAQGFSSVSANIQRGIGSYASHLAAGVVGGALVLIGSHFTASPPPPPVDPLLTANAIQELGRRLTSIEQAAKDRAARLQSVESSLTRLDDVSKTVGSLGEAQTRLADALKEAKTRPAGDVDTSGKIAKLEEQLGAIAAAAADPQNGGRIPQLAQIIGKLSDLEASTAERLVGLRKDMGQEIDARLASVAEASEAAKAGAVRLDREVAATRSENARLGQRIDAVRAGSDRLEQALRSLQTDASALKTTLETFKSEMEGQLRSTAKPGDVSTAVAPVAAKVAALEASVQSVVRSEDERKANAERIVLSLELGDLKRAMDRGGAYAAELAPVKKLAGTRVDLAPLERYQHDGVPTQAELVRSFRDVANAALDADSEQPDASVVDRLLSGARSIVRVRKITHSADDQSTEAIIGRMETALKENRLGDVLAEGKKLPARAAVPVFDWLKKVEARQSVEAALASIDADLKTSLGLQKGGKQ